MERIVCLEHCGHRIFGFDLPDKCPICSISLGQCQLSVPPFSIPSPFARAQDHGCAVVIKPTRGNFLNKYQSGDNLHCAVTNSKGFVVEFDESGVHLDQTLDWNHCLVIKVLENSNLVDLDVVSDPDWAEYWDYSLESFAQSKLWTKETYDELTNNCFTFVLGFLKSLRHEPLSSLVLDKVDFCQQFLLPKTSVAAKFIHLYRHLVSDPQRLYVRPLK